MNKTVSNKNYYLGIINCKIVAIADDIGKERILRDCGIGYGITFNPGYPRGITDYSMILSEHDFHHARQRFKKFIDLANKLLKYDIDSSYADGLDLESINEVYTKIKRIISNEMKDDYHVLLRYSCIEYKSCIECK